MPLHVAQILERAAAEHPERVALIDRGDGSPTCEASRWFTFAQWHHAALRWANWLHQCDVRDGDRVALLAGNSLEFAAQWFGVVAAGCTVVPIPTGSSVDDARHRIDHARCRVLLCDQARLPLARQAIANVAKRPIVALDSDVAIDESLVVTPVSLDAGDQATAMILYTSGTTGHAKGACISHRALMTHTRVLSEQVLQLDIDDRVLGVLPLTHSYGCRMLLLATAHARATTLLMSRFDAVHSLSIMQQEAITWLPAVPTMFSAWCNAVDRDSSLKLRANGAAMQGARLKWAMSAGAPIPDALVQRAEAALGAQVRQAYGMTEATLSTVNGPGDARVIGCVGRPAPGVALRIVDSDGADVAPGETGEVWVRGHNTMNGYLDDPEATANALRDGWFQSGDVGRIDAEGNLWIVDRIKDLIIVGGFNVYPSEVEAVIAEHPSVAEVAVIGRPHPHYGEEVIALIVPRPADVEHAVLREALLAHCRERLSKLKCPRDVVFRESFPLGPSGKVLKRLLRQQLTASAEPAQGEHGAS